MNSSGSGMELQSNRWMQGNTSDRPSFDVLISRGLGGARRFQVFLMTKGLLCLDKGPPRAGGGGGGDNNGAIVAGAMLGGLAGAAIAHALTSNSGGSCHAHEERYDLCDEDELLELAAARKKSFVAFYDDIGGVSLDVPGMWEKIFGDGRTVGWITLREKSLGKVAMEVRDPAQMQVAIDTLPRRLGPRVQVNLQLDPRTTTYVRK
ncbi:MAG TPA: hypothetical protein VFV87_20630 [Pirellulaceae bacterium]|nr:hypothetical protein [Pirellulaceae bacterium]